MGSVSWRICERSCHFFPLYAEDKNINFSNIALAQKQSRVLQTTAAEPSEAATSRSSSSSSSNEEDDSDRDSDSDSNGDSDNDGGRPNLSPAQLREDVEIRLVAFRRDQEATLQEFRANNY